MVGVSFSVRVGLGLGLLVFFSQVKLQSHCKQCHTCQLIKNHNLEMTIPQNIDVLKPKETFSKLQYTTCNLLDYQLSFIESPSP